MTMTQQFANTIVSTVFEDLPQDAISRAKLRILDGIGVVSAGRNTVGCEAVARLIKEWGGVEESSLFFSKAKVPAQNAALCNGMMMRGLDFEAIQSEGPNQEMGSAHISGSTIPCALAMGEKQHSSGKELIAALILGDDLASRLSVASGFSFTDGWDNTGTVNGFGCAAIASKLLGLNPTQTKEALAFVLNHLGGTMDNVSDHAVAFKYPQGLSAYNGIFAARIAQIGLAGCHDPIGGPHGYFSLYANANAKPELALQDLGKTFCADRVYKMWPCCRMNQAAVDCAIQIAQSNSIKASEIERVVIRVSATAALTNVELVYGDYPQISAGFNVRFVTITALLEGCFKARHYSDEWYQNSDFNAVLGKTEIEVAEPSDDPKLKRLTGLSVYLLDGSVLKSQTAIARGDIYDNPVSEREVRDKYWDNMTYSGLYSGDVIKEVEECIDHLEDLADVGKLVMAFAS